ncbi:MAG: M13 family metallopeptidase N-terminal domain-containing protein, partial [Terracidiphilus sp.]|nr:M13 family metallopeptidase N-terminal domain-containing protein [Terracidiphilus sp.]
MAIVLAAVPALGQTAAPAATPVAAELRVFDASLVDKTVDPCDNFYRFSCNGWFKRNPLPADQARYGRFTELSELNRLHMRQILEEAAVPASARNANEPPRSTNEQKIGDEYASCMDTATVNRLGLTPLKPELERIAALRSAAELPALLAHLHAMGVNVFFNMGSSQDFADASAVISFYNAGGLGLPERDYYTRSDAKSVELRRQYAAHVRNLFTLAGEPEAQAAHDADAVLALETRLAKASLTITEQRDPQNLNHPTDVASFQKELTHFSLADYVAAAHAPATGRMNDTEPKFFAEFN